MTTKQEQIDTIQDLLCEFHNAELCSYSGRAMYGSQCLGIRMESMEDAFRFALMIDDAELADTLSNPRFDDMGRGIILYFPNVKAPEGLGDDEDED